MSDDDTFDTIPSDEWDASIEERAAILQSFAALSDAVRTIEKVTQSDALQLPGVSRDEFGPWIETLESALERLRRRAKQT